MKFPKIFQSKEDPRVIELEAENRNLKDQIIADLKDKLEQSELNVAELKLQTKDLADQLISHHDGPKKYVPQRPRIRTMSEVVRKLEENSMRKHGVLNDEAS